ncbi:MAG: sigma-70 family RNA polymerase sigma factor [Candidatus Pacebacteria bacterium]|nr:sigma-70 family RNA polymerase sigma factor [Candidatus Paceibacterota bacterium]
MKEAYFEKNENQKERAADEPGGKDFDLLKTYEKDIGKRPLLTLEEEKIIFDNISRVKQELVNRGEMIKENIREDLTGKEREKAEKIFRKISLLQERQDPQKEQKHLSDEDIFFLEENSIGWPEEIKGLVNEYQELRKKAIEGNLRLVVRIARAFSNKCDLPAIDLINEGNIGLMRAIDGFRPEKGFKFSTYATYWICQAILRATVEKEHIIRTPNHIHERAKKIGNAKKALEKRGLDISVSELASQIGLPQEEIRKIMEYEKRMAPLVPLETQDPDERDPIETINSLSEHDPLEETLQKERIEKLLEILNSLSEKEKAVITQRFGLDGEAPRTLEQIAQDLGVTRERVRQIQIKALAKLESPTRKNKLKELL